ncbi:MAG: pilus assembly protein PilM [Thermosediminibacteraceae bacterium]|nr:pilus assembly protein PilM [Thermosediminibacteraceae bacterium]
MLNFSSFIGLDVGNKNIKVVKIRKYKDKVKVKNFWSIPYPSAKINFSKEEKREILARSFEPLKEFLKSGKIIIGIPSDKVLFRNLSFPRMRYSELKEAAFWETRELVAQLDGDYVLDFEIMKENKNTYEVLVAAVLKDHVMDYLDPMKRIGLLPEAVDIYPLAISRVFKYLFSECSFVVVDIGALKTEIILFEHGKIFLTSTFSFGSEYMTRLIAGTFSVDESEAELIKINPGACREKIAECLYPLIRQLVLQVARCLKYYLQKKGQGVKAIVLTGGGSKLFCLKEVFSREIKVEVFTAQELDFPKIEIEEKIRGEFDKMEFLSALGFAMRGV